MASPKGRRWVARLEGNGGYSERSLYHYEHKRCYKTSDGISKTRMETQLIRSKRVTLTEFSGGMRDKKDVKNEGCSG